MTYQFVTEKGTLFFTRMTEGKEDGMVIFEKLASDRPGAPKIMRMEIPAEFWCAMVASMTNAREELGSFDVVKKLHMQKKSEWEKQAPYNWKPRVKASSGKSGTV